MAAKHSYMKLSSESSDFVFDYCSPFEYSSFIKNNVKCYPNEYKSAFTYSSISSEENISECHKEPWLSVVFRHGIFCVSCLIALLLFPVSVFLCVKRVHSLERLVVSRLGKLQPIKGPGFVLVLPFVEHWTKVDLHPKQLTVSTPQVLTADGGVVEVTANINYQVSDVLHYVTKSSNPFKSVLDLSSYSLVNIITGKDQEELEKNRETINEALKVELNKTVVKWGVEIVSITLGPVKILKAAEPVNVINTLMGAFKAVAQQSSFIPICAGIINESPESLSALPVEKPTEPEVAKECSHIVSVLEHFATSAVNKGKVNGVSAIIKLEIVCTSPEIVHIIISDGNVTVHKSIEPEQNPDVLVVLTAGALQDILNGKINAIEAYMEGKITVSGNWTLLNTLSELLK